MKKRIKKVISKISICLCILFGYYFLNQYTNFAIPCIFHKLTNLYCPGCGITRCIFSLIKGNILLALKYNALVSLMFPFVLVMIIVNSYLYIKEERTIKVDNYIYIIILIVTIIFGILRNIQLFSFLKP